MEEILHIENEIILSLVESELDNLGIEYFVKKNDIEAIPSNLQKNYYAILFSGIENRKIIFKIYESIESGEVLDEDELKNYKTVKPEQIPEEEQISKKRSVINIWIILIFIIMAGVIIFQYLTYDKLIKSLNIHHSSYYYYKFSYNGAEVEQYLRKGNKLTARYIDNNQNGLDEKIEVFLPNGYYEIYEDSNENGYTEKISTYFNNNLLIEWISTNDNGITDITYYYENGKVKNILYYDEKNNTVRLE